MLATQRMYAGEEVVESTALLENVSRLETLATECQDNYVKAADKGAALAQTREQTIASLATVVSQVNNMAVKFLQILESQENKLAEMQHSLGYLTEEMTRKRHIQTVNAIKGFTSQKLPPSNLKGSPTKGVIFPTQKEDRKRYARTAKVDYTILDGIGHGVFDESEQTSTGPVYEFDDSSEYATLRVKAAAARPRIDMTDSQVSNGPDDMPPSSETQPSQAPQAPPPPPFGGGPPAPPPPPIGGAPPAPTPPPIGGAPPAPPPPPIGGGPPPPPPPPIGGAPPAPPPPPVGGGPPAPPPPPIGGGPPAPPPPPIGGGPPAPPPPPVGGGPPAPPPPPPVGGGPAAPPPPPIGGGAPPPPPPPPPIGGTGVKKTTTSTATSQPSQPRQRQVAPEVDFQSVLREALKKRKKTEPEETVAETKESAPNRPEPSQPAMGRTPTDDNEMAFPPPPTPGTLSQGATHAFDLDKRTSSESAVVDNVPEWVPADYIEKVIALYDYVNEADDELSFSEGDTIYVTARDESGWWHGSCNGAAGFFPHNYVEALTDIQRPRLHSQVRQSAAEELRQSFYAEL